MAGQVKGLHYANISTFTTTLANKPVAVEAAVQYQEIDHNATKVTSINYVQVCMSTKPQRRYSLKLLSCLLVSARINREPQLPRLRMSLRPRC